MKEFVQSRMVEWLCMVEHGLESYKDDGLRHRKDSFKDTKRNRPSISSSELVSQYLMILCLKRLCLQCVPLLCKANRDQFYCDT